MNSTGFTRPRVLVIEDEPAIADTIRYALTTEGMEVAWHATGGEGWNRLQEETFQLVILDLGLPDSNGFDLCRQIRARLDLPVIILTARSAEIDRVAGLETGADDYVVKPFSPRELAARVRAVLRRAQPGSPPAEPAAQPLPGRSSGVFTIDTNRRQIIYRGHPLELSRHEYDLLKVLLDRPGWVFSREQLMNLTWDSPESALDRTVDSHIKNIRAKLRAAGPGADPIVTHRGSGYSLREEE